MNATSREFFYLQNILVKISKLPLDFVSQKCYCGQLYRITISLTTVFDKPQYIHFLTIPKQNPVLNVIIRWDPCVQNRTWAILGRKMVYVLIRFYLIYRLHVIYSNKVLLSIFINIKCLRWYDSTMFFYSSLVHMRPILCRCFCFLMIENMLW